VKRTKLLALILVVALMLVGAGYAAWTDVIVHNTTINTGEFDIIFTRKFAKADVSYKSDAIKALKLEDNFLAGTPDYGDNNKTVNFTFSNAFPGTSMQTSTTATNKGTLPAYINEVVVDVDVTNSKTESAVNNSKLLDAMEVDYVYYIMKDGQTVQQARKTIRGTATLGELENELKAKLEGEYLAPGEELTNGEEEAAYKLVFSIPADSLVEDEAENEMVSISITYNFVQHNEYVPK
jgi:hypothetical protein